MNRRGFLKLLGIGAAGLAVEQAIPFGRVWSFPSQIVVPSRFLTTPESTIVWLDKVLIANLKRACAFQAFSEAIPLPVSSGNEIQFFYPNFRHQDRTDVLGLGAVQL